MDIIRPQAKKITETENNLSKTISADQLVNEHIVRAAGKKLITWKAPEYHHYEKTNDWFWWAGLLAIILLGFATWQGSFLFGILILISWFVIVLYAVRKPDEIDFALSENGILIDNKLYSWQSLKSFWIFHNPPFPTEVSFESKKTLMPYIRVPLGDKNLDEVKTLLKKHLREVEQEESIIDHLAHLARF